MPRLSRVALTIAAASVAAIVVSGAVAAHDGEPSVRVTAPASHRAARSS